MKVLLFTHISDIDGLNNVVLAKQAFNYVDYVLCEANEIDYKFKKQEKTFNKYDYIYITDLCLSDGLLSIIDNSDLKNKIKIFDHHEGAFEQLSKNYDFVTMKIKENNKLTSGTSLFYKYLVKNNYLIPSDSLDKMVELTRKYDTWEWKKDNDIEARNLTWLFYACGADNYLEIIQDKIKNDSFYLDENDLNKINIWRKNLEEEVEKVVHQMKIMKIQGYDAGIVKTIHEYRNEVSDHVKEKKYDIDFLAIIFYDKNSVSYRSINDKVDVNEIAKVYGGKGHKKASASPISNEEKKDYIKYFLKGDSM